MQAPGCRALSYSTCIAAAVGGIPQRGVVHSVFDAAANIVFPRNTVLSLNCISSARMANGLQLSAPAGSFPFPALNHGMPVLLGAQRLHIEAISCSLDLSLCTQWDPHIQRPEPTDIERVKKNGQWLSNYIATRSVVKARWSQVETLLAASERDYRAMAYTLCGRGPGLTPSGDDMLAGWMAAGWLLHGPAPVFLEACQQIVKIAQKQTHLLSQCWLSYAAQGNVAEPIGRLLTAITGDDDRQLALAADAVLAMGATSGSDVIQGILLGLRNPFWTHSSISTSPICKS